MLHAYAAALPDVMRLSARDSVLPVVPMFHVNAWGIPYSAALIGAKLVFPGPALDGKSVYELIETEKVTFAAGVPTVWQMLLGHMQAERACSFSHAQAHRDRRLGLPAGHDRRLPASDYGVEVLHAWGMTEMSPLGTLCTLKNKHLDAAAEEQHDDPPEAGPRDLRRRHEDRRRRRQGAALGRQGLRRPAGQGPVGRREYFKGEGGDPLVRRAGRGWFPTGDVATIDADGFMQITDRSKDVIKSGGEWISSIDIENIAVAHPAVAMAACIGVRAPEVGRAADAGGGEEARRRGHARGTARRSTKARSPSGRFPTTWCSSRRSRSAPPARS